MLLGAIMLSVATGTTINGWVIMYAISQLVYGVGVGGTYCTVSDLLTSATLFMLCMLCTEPCPKLTQSVPETFKVHVRTCAQTLMHIADYLHTFTLHMHCT